jgi:hypothetical protein
MSTISPGDLTRGKSLKRWQYNPLQNSRQTNKNHSELSRTILCRVGFPVGDVAAPSCDLSIKWSIGLGLENLKEKAND